jgi:hypothetical protein
MVGRESLLLGACCKEGFRELPLGLSLQHPSVLMLAFMVMRSESTKTPLELGLWFTSLIALAFSSHQISELCLGGE